MSAAERGFRLDQWVAKRRAEVDALLDARLPARPREDDPGRLVEAMRYSLLAPGKRVRPLLALAAAEAVGAPLTDQVRTAAAAVELVHCYSLVHDDLPSMDDDDMRRGRPTNHKVFGEAVAILAGDGLLTLAFEWLAQAGAEAEAASAGTGLRYLGAASALARGAGVSGMVRGQARDLGEPAPTSLVGVEQLHAEKTGALFRAALEVGASVAGASRVETAALERYAVAYGLAFQHADDLADEEHVAFSSDAKARLRALTRQATDAVAIFGDRAAPLCGLAEALADSVKESTPR